MESESDNSVFAIPSDAPSFERQAAYAFVEPEPVNDICQELAALSEEIQTCRSRFLQSY